ncbi:hypothetical protein TWF569_011441 [Orbilia oligospora]|uniref:Uncharacterized protein n=2 Tax=Orbilia oligospora TaxID=2813651 RepID=G1XQ34_ARTOA|nr:hypothetical protein AOL_s00188g45 [Orbilia oligospora ATCC 24927]KAF3088415.1 hypothetical protein TWF706_010732 [Orbilia oligospora]EGX44707.1 hypothetical protein AOL_s00188g45 [Orbilia oligospora ATCC 24927]KAF3091039.1 hypothetical protein TWF102_008922 [Orbilia oligospora]KAF3097852.1 hypothetical protein TWF103_009244 [Orbilia oligospora]KAF3131124.1 hypothetical protein TWF569_011441 [Orbilia oligospora]
MTSRLRRPFTASASDDEVDDDNIIPLDEQEQEALIEELKKANDRENAFFILVFTCLCGLTASLIAIRIWFGNGSGVDVLAVSSLAMTGFTVRIPVGSEAKELLSPLETWVPILNPILIAIITIGAYFTNRHWDHDYLLYLPLFVWIATAVGRKAMASVNLGELEKLKYKYKGA